MATPFQFLIVTFSFVFEAGGALDAATVEAVCRLFSHRGVEVANFEVVNGVCCRRPEVVGETSSDGLEKLKRRFKL